MRKCDNQNRSRYPGGRSFLGFLGVGALVCASMLMVAAQSASAQARKPEAAEALAALLDKAEREGTVRVIVRLMVAAQPQGDLKDPDVIQALRGIVAAAQTSLLARMSGLNITNVKRMQYTPFIAMDVDEEALRYLLSDPEVVSVQEDKFVPPLLIDTIPLIGANIAWAHGFEGTGQFVAILDTGVATGHSFFTGKVFREACFSSNTGAPSTTVCPDNSEAQIGPGAGVNCDLAIDGCDHGTHVAGIAAGQGVNSGVARDADIIAIQVFSEFTDPGTCAGFGLPTPCALTFTSDQISGLEHVITLSGSLTIASVNMSLGGGGSSTACDGDPRKPAIDILRGVGIATVAAAGNSGSSTTIIAPACISTAVSVSCTDKTDGICPFSQRAPILDLFAPGLSVNSSVPPNAFGVKSGTSMSAPHVAGAWAVLKEAMPAASVADILAILVNTGVPIFDAGSGLTFPRIQLDAALDLELDHFLSYKVKRTKKTPKFVKRVVSLADQFETKDFKVKKPKFLLTPADKGGEGINDPVHHLKAYKIKKTKGQGKHVKQKNIKVDNQFGTIFVDTKKPDLLLVPTLKDPDNPVVLPEPFTPPLDHFKCYRVRRTKGTSKFTPETVNVSDQFINTTLLVKKPVRLCVPVDKDGKGIIDPVAHLMCYKVEKVKIKVEGIHVNNQFGPEQLDTKKVVELCVPSTKTP
ncbi:MAG: S8 family serine peptidase [Nitrospinae bacterium]|nr:S8 family serine peptidase [Nitrospinota bacterium]